MKRLIVSAVFAAVIIAFLYAARHGYEKKIEREEKAAYAERVRATGERFADAERVRVTRERSRINREERLARERQPICGSDFRHDGNAWLFRNLHHEIDWVPVGAFALAAAADGYDDMAGAMIGVHELLSEHITERRIPGSALCRRYPWLRLPDPAD